jgi:hypothetical protein
VELNVHLLNDSQRLTASPGDLNACINSHGLYNSFQFVLRLSPEVHRKIAALPHGIVERPLDPDGVQAFSTYLHETIHWWQHVGSTIGLLLSLSYPAQAHANYTQLKKLLAVIGPKKSVYRLLETRGLDRTGDPTTPGGLANVILNNYFDMESFRLLVNSPAAVRELVENPLFESIGHSYQVALANIVLTLASMFDKSFQFIPDARSWEKPFSHLRTQKERGYYHGSDVRVAPIAALEIFEGQARFGQLQYLYFASGGKLRWEDVASKGMLGGAYGSAFETFLRLAELAWPPTIDDPTVALFLLICDMAINPGTGFPMPLLVFKTFIEDLNPAIRFLFLCRAIPTRLPHAAKAITQYARSEYAEVSEALSHALLLDSPLAIAKKLEDWMCDSEQLALL